MADKITSGRPISKPKRKFTGFALNTHFSDKLQLLQIKWGESSLNDTYNRMILETLKREKLI
jgi:hypothetical protein